MARQVLLTAAHGRGLRWALLSAADYRRWAGNIRQHRKRTGAMVHFRALPQADGKIFVMSSHGLVSDPVPTDRRALFDLLRHYATPLDGKRASSSRGFGGDYKRLHGDGRDNPIIEGIKAKIKDLKSPLAKKSARIRGLKVRIQNRLNPIDELARMATEARYWKDIDAEMAQLLDEECGRMRAALPPSIFDDIDAAARWTIELRDAETDLAEARLGIADDLADLEKELAAERAKNKPVRVWTAASLETVGAALGADVKRGHKTIRVQIDAADSFQKLTAAGITMRARKGQGLAVKVLAAALAGDDVTLKAQSPEPEFLCLKRDNGGGAPDIVPDLCPPLFDFSPDEVRQWPI